MTATARRTDPQTSLVAAERHERSGAATSSRALVLEMVEQWPDHTAVELWDMQQWSHNALSRHEISRRLPELREAGLVENPTKRDCAIAGTLQMTWRVVDDAPLVQGELF